MSSGGAGGDGLETNVSYSVGKPYEMKDGSMARFQGYKCRRCNKVLPSKEEKVECERKCMVKDLRNRDRRVEPGSYR